MNDLILAAGADSSSFWNTPIGGFIGNMLLAVGVLVLLGAIFKSIGSFISGKIGKGMQSLVGGLIIATLCFKPDLLDGFIDLVANLLTLGSDSVDQLGDGAPVGDVGKGE